MCRAAPDQRSRSLSVRRRVGPTFEKDTLKGNFLVEAQPGGKFRRQLQRIDHNRVGGASGEQPALPICCHSLVVLRRLQPVGSSHRSGYGDERAAIIFGLTKQLRKPHGGWVSRGQVGGWRLGECGQGGEPDVMFVRAKNRIILDDPIRGAWHRSGKCGSSFCRRGSGRDFAVLDDRRLRFARLTVKSVIEVVFRGHRRGRRLEGTISPHRLPGTWLRRFDHQQHHRHQREHQTQQSQLYRPRLVIRRWGSAAMDRRFHESRLSNEDG